MQLNFLFLLSLYVCMKILHMEIEKNPLISEKFSAGQGTEETKPHFQPVSVACLVTWGAICRRALHLVEYSTVVL